MFAPSRLKRIAAATLVLGAVALTVLAASASQRGSSILLGPEAPVGGGTARLFVDVAADGTPQTLGILLTEAALGGLPEHMNTTSRCFDKNGDGRMSHGECLGDYQSTLAMPAGAERLGLPFRWATVNWNPEGHLDPAPPVWSAAHYDFHFFIAEPSLIEGIRPGPCGEFIDCEDFATASIPLPPTHLPEDYIDVGAAVPAMGNHLVDSQDPELSDPTLGFSRTLIYGVYGGKVIFMEPMVSRAFLLTQPDSCSPVKAPQAWGTPGYYPTRYCTRYDAATATYRITFEGLVMRRAA